MRFRRMFLVALIAIPGFAQFQDPRPKVAQTIQSVSIVGVRSGVLQEIERGPGVTGGQEATGAVTITSARSEPMNVSLSSNNTTLATVPPVVRIDAGATRATFPILSYPVATTARVTITASRSTADSKSTVLAVVPTALAGLTVDSTAVLGGPSISAHLRFTGPPPASPNVVASISSSEPAAAGVQGSVTLPQGRTAVDFPINTHAVAENKTVMIIATYGGRQQTVIVAISKPALRQIGDFPSFSTTIDPVTFPVILTGVAPPGGVVVGLTSNDPQKFPVPATVSIPANQDKALVSIDIPLQVTSGTAVITAKYDGVTKSLSFSVVPPDIKFSKVEFIDRYGNVITRAADSQPFKVCATLGKSWTYGPPNTTLLVAYKTKTPGAPSSSGREFELPANFSPVPWATVRVCTELPGLETGQSHEVTLKADSHNVVEEGYENNNTSIATIVR